MYQIEPGSRFLTSPFTVSREVDKGGIRCTVISISTCSREAQGRGDTQVKQLTPEQKLQLRDLDTAIDVAIANRKVWYIENMYALADLVRHEPRLE